MNKSTHLMTSTSVKALAVGVVAAGFAVAQAQAATATFNAATALSIATSAAQTSNGLISLTAGATGNARAFQIAPAAGKTLGTGATFSIVLPSGFTFVGTPSCQTGDTTNTVAAAGSCAVINSPAGTNTLIVQVAGAPVADEALFVGAATGFSTKATSGTNSTALVFNTGSALYTPSATPFTATVTLTSVGAGGTDTSVAGAVIGNALPFLTAASPITATIADAAAAPAPQIDVTTTGAAKAFVASVANNRTARTSQQGSATFAVPGGTLDATGAAYVVPASTSVGLTVSGNYTNLSRVYVSQANCQTTAGGTLDATGILGTVSGNAASFSGLSSQAVYNLCLENSGSGILYATSYSASPNLNGTAFATVGGASAIGSLAYNGNPANINYVTGGSAYQYFIRATNTSTSEGLVFVAVTKDDGTAFGGYLTTSLGANTNALFSVEDVNAATGANLTAADRARLLVVTRPTPAASSTAGGILFNTATGVITTAQ